MHSASAPLGQAALIGVWNDFANTGLQGRSPAKGQAGRSSVHQNRSSVESVHFAMYCVYCCFFLLLVGFFDATVHFT